MNIEIALYVRVRDFSIEDSLMTEGFLWRILTSDQHISLSTGDSR
jgi:hypothetical protein